MPATQAELGDAFGLSTVHVNRTLQKLREEGLVVTKGRRITSRCRAANEGGRLRSCLPPGQRRRGALAERPPQWRPL